MTNDELDRALFALALEELPAGLHDRILAATVYHAPALFRTWELWLLAAAVAIVGFVTFALLTAVPHLGDQLQSAIVSLVHALGLFSVATYAWLAVGASAVWAISSLPLMPRARRAAYDR